jgi:hypothetical protein
MKVSVIVFTMLLLVGACASRKAPAVSCNSRLRPINAIATSETPRAVTPNSQVPGTVP